MDTLRCNCGTTVLEDKEEPSQLNRQGGKDSQVESCLTADKSEMKIKHDDIWIDLNGCNAGMHYFQRDDDGIIRPSHSDETPCESIEFNFSGMLRDLDASVRERR